MSSPHLFHLSAETPQDKTEGGERIRAYSDNFPILKGMSLYKVLLRPRGVREPHWHPNADELGYCLKGQVLVAFYHTGDLKQTFLVQAGEMFFIPSGALHYIANVGKENAELLLQFSHENAEEFALSSSIGMFSNSVLGNTWGVSHELFNKLHRPLKERFAVLIQAPESIPPEAQYSNPYHYNVEASLPILNKAVGSVRVARQNVWPILKCQSLYSLKLADIGMREPHWHPETAELGYVQSGRGRMTILNPNGDVDTYLIQPGDLYYIPKAYPHHIENVGQGQDLLHILIFFDQAMPRDIGFTGSVRSFSNEVLGSVLQVEPSFFENLNKYYADLLIVDKINPLDP
jgi:oxalate decarboxylase